MINNYKVLQDVFNKLKIQKVSLEKCMRSAPKYQSSSRIFDPLSATKPFIRGMAISTALLFNCLAADEVITASMKGP